MTELSPLGLPTIPVPLAAFFKSALGGLPLFLLALFFSTCSLVASSLVTGGVMTSLELLFSVTIGKLPLHHTRRMLSRLRRVYIYKTN